MSYMAVLTHRLSPGPGGGGGQAGSRGGEGGGGGAGGGGSKGEQVLPLVTLVCFIVGQTYVLYITLICNGRSYLSPKMQ